MFTAMADVETMLGVEKIVKTSISNYISAERERLDRLEKFASEYETKNSDLLRQGQAFLANPVNAFLMVKRLTSDWSHVETLMRDNNAEKFISNITESRTSSRSNFPAPEDLAGAATALLRLQDTYALDTADIAAGRLGQYGASQARELTAHDCFELGRVSYNDNDYYHTLLWMQEAYNRLEHEDPPTADHGEVLEYLSYAMYQQGNNKRALQLVQRLYELDPEHPRAAGNVKFYQDLVEKEQNANPDALPRAEDVANARPRDTGVPERERYEALCRGEFPLPAAKERSLHCHYVRGAHPFLRIAHYRIEQIHRKPMIWIYRDIISDREIDVIKEMAFPRLKRATVQNSQTGELEVARYRISKSAWLKGEEHPVVDNLHKRMGMLTGLNMATAEDLQVANYGLGGHYDPHFDFARKEETNAFKGLGTGNRIATWLTYMSQPEAGGATVFTDLRLTLYPTKYDAAFWFNLYPSGEGDMSTRHAACPVLAGTKWVSNKWIHEIGQEFTRPCGLEEWAYA